MPSAKMIHLSGNKNIVDKMNIFFIMQYSKMIVIYYSRDANGYYLPLVERKSRMSRNGRCVSSNHTSVYFALRRGRAYLSTPVARIKTNETRPHRYRIQRKLHGLARYVGDTTGLSVFMLGNIIHVHTYLPRSKA